MSDPLLLATICGVSVGPLLVTSLAVMGSPGPATISLAVAEASSQHPVRRSPCGSRRPDSSELGAPRFTLVEECEVEYSPGSFMRCNDWRLDLFARS